MSADPHPAPPLELRLLGGVSLRNSGGPVTGRAAQKRRLAILALLASSPDRALSRDKLIALLWSDASADEARHRLAVSLYEMRRGLGECVLESRGDDVVLSDRVIADTDRFRLAVLREDWEEAIRQYGGPFLDGFHLGHSAPFEDWLDVERRGYAQLIGRSLERAAEGRARQGDLSGAVGILEQLSSLEPYSARVVVRMATLLAEGGERAEALRFALRFDERVRTELSVESDPEIARLIEQLTVHREVESGPRAALTPSRAAAQHAGGATGAPSSPAPPAVNAAPREGAMADAEAAPAPRRLPFVRHLTRRRTTAAAAGLLVLALAVWSRQAQPAAPMDDGHERVAVLPFAVRGDDAQYLREGMMDLLSAGLEGADGMRTISSEAILGFLGERTVWTGDVETARALASRLGAHVFVLGSVHSSGTDLQLTATAYGRDRRQPLAQATVQGDASGLFALVDQLTAALLAERRGSPAERLSQLAARTTRSLPALKSYLVGEQLFRGGRFAESVEAFGRAAALDSTFALAHYRLTLSMLWADVPDTLPFDAQERAVRFSEHLPVRDRMLIRAFASWREGEADEAERLYRSLVAMYPDDVEAWHQLGETMFHYNAVRGRRLGEARDPFERALALDQRHWGARWHLALLAASERRLQDLEQHVRHLLELRQEGPEALELHVIRAAARRDSAAVSQLLPALQATSDLRLVEIQWRVAVHGGDLETASRVADLLTKPERGQYARAVGHEALAYLALAQGRFVDAELHIEALSRLQPRLDAWVSILALCHPDRPRGDGRALRVPRPEWTARGPLTSSEMYFEGVLAAESGDSATAGHWARRMAASPQEGGELAGSLQMALLARLAHLRGDHAQAVQLVEESRVPRWFGLSNGNALISRPHERYLLAEALFALGRFDDAEGWFASIGDHSLHDLPYVAPAQRRLAELYERRGQHHLAARHRARASELLRSADPGLRPPVRAQLGRRPS